MEVESTELSLKPEKRDTLPGRYDHRLDSKRRVIIPLLWYERMGCPKEVYVRRSLTGETCLEVLTVEDFEARQAPFRHRPLSDKRAAAFQRALSEVSELIPVDTQNRICLPDKMLAFAQLDADIVLLGRSKIFEVWSLARRPKDGMDNEQSMADLVAAAEEYGV